jgi:hypothetical protein
MRISNDQRLVYHLFFPFQVGFSYLEKLQVWITQKKKQYLLDSEEKVIWENNLTNEVKTMNKPKEDEIVKSIKL